MKLSIEQIRDMRHAIGGKIVKKPYRNYFNTGEDSESWNELVQMRLAFKEMKSKEMGGCYYYVTSKGIDILNSILKG